MNQKKINSNITNNIKYLVMFFLVFIFIFLSACFVYNGLDNKVYNKVNYESSSNIDYKVYLKENSFFTEPYLEMNKTYIASLINYIDVLFSYNLKYDKMMAGTYKYYVKGTILANKNDKSEDINYWSKTYELTKPEVIEFNGQDNFNVMSNVKLDYQKYSKLLKEFRQTYGLSVNGIFKLELVVESVGQASDMDRDVMVNSNVLLSIPLTEQAIELSIDSENVNDNGSVTEVIKLTGFKYTFYLILAVIFALVALYFIFIIIRDAYITFKNRSEYYKKLKKILSTYDSIIVNTTKIPNLNKLDVINVQTFQELIDAHSEVRMPINFVEKEKGLKSIFILASNNMAWMYELKHEDYNKLKKKK